MSFRRVPRALVVSLATAILCVPAIAALADQYIRDSQNRVVHLHRGVYEIYNNIDGTTGMQSSAGFAINNWGNQLTTDDTVAVRAVTTATGAEATFRDYDLPDGGAAVLWSESWHQTALPLDVVFDESKEASWSQDTKQHKACNVIGNILGLADTTGTDCMNPANSYPTVSQANVDAVDSFYGPNVSFGNDLFANASNLDSASAYTLDATATGHAIQSIAVTLDGSTNQIASRSITPCDGSCSVGVSPSVGPLSVGTHTISATATNQFGQTHTEPPLTLTVAPDTVIDSGPSGPTNVARPTFTYHSPTTGTTFQCKVDQASYATCPVSGYTPSAALADGSHTFYVRANSSGHTDPSPASQNFTVDTVPPVLSSLSGDFTDQTNPLLGAGPLEDVTATDSGTGVAQAVLKIDGTEVETLNPDDGCANPCSLDDTFLPEISDLASGSHNYQIIATDAAGNDSLPRSGSSGSFVLDPTGPQIAVTGALADSSGGPLNSATAAASITATDNASGDSGIASVEVTVDDETDQTYTQTCAPTCPSSVSASYTYSKAAWGPGPHSVAFIATDKAGNEETTKLDVDEPSTDPIATCPTPQAQQQAPGQTVTAAVAATQAIAPMADATAGPGATDPDGADPLKPTLVASDDGPQWMQSDSSLSVDEISQGPAPSIDVGDEICLVPTQTTSAEPVGKDDTTGGGDVRVYPNTATNTDTFVRPTVGGEDIIESIRASNAPTSYSFAAGIPPGDQLQQLASGGVAVVNPTQPAPADPLAPDPYAQMSASTITSNLTSPATQLDEHNRAITSAEQETNHSVDAVVQAPQIVNSLDNTTFSTLTLSGSTITVNVPSGTKAVVLKAHSNVPTPKAAPSWYMQGPQGNLINEAVGFTNTFCDKQLVGNRLLILDFENVNEFKDHSYGTFNGNYLHDGAIYHALHHAAMRYQQCRLTTGWPTIIYGNSNRKAPKQPDMGNYFAAGEAQAHVLGRLRGHLLGDEHAGAGGDLEPTYTGPDNAKALARGATEKQGGPYIDFGTANIHDAYAKPGWTEPLLCDVAHAGGSRLPLPQIYHRGDAVRWGEVQHDCGGGFRFLGVYTSWAANNACGFCTTSLNGKGFGPAHAWRHLRHESSARVGHEISDDQN
jgi:hypothetical protein